MDMHYQNQMHMLVAGAPQLAQRQANQYGDGNLPEQRIDRLEKTVKSLESQVERLTIMIKAGMEPEQ
ncbi:MAG: hypothetical protein JKY50_12905 [Oleispira sp.]|nr:hypothetical protein [Oleispira sp.]